MKVLKMLGLCEIGSACKEDRIPASSLKLSHLEGYCWKATASGYFMEEVSF
jgi:hypothetical protein